MKTGYEKWLHEREQEQKEEERMQQEGNKRTEPIPREEKKSTRELYKDLENGVLTLPILVRTGRSRFYPNISIMEKDTEVLRVIYSELFKNHSLYLFNTQKNKKARTTLQAAYKILDQAYDIYSSGENRRIIDMLGDFPPEKHDMEEQEKTLVHLQVQITDDLAKRYTVFYKGIQEERPQMEKINKFLSETGMQTLGFLFKWTNFLREICTSLLKGEILDGCVQVLTDYIDHALQKILVYHEYLQYLYDKKQKEQERTENTKRSERTAKQDERKAMQEDFTNFFKGLSMEEARKKYRQKMRTLHPDNNGNETDAQELNRIWQNFKSANKS